MKEEERCEMTARVGRRRGDGTEKHSGSRSAVTGVDGRTDGRTDERMEWLGWLGWFGRENPAAARPEKAVEFDKLDSLRRRRKCSDGEGGGKERGEPEKSGGGGGGEEGW